MATATSTTQKKVAGSFEAMKGDFGYTSRMQAPRVTKIVVSTGVGSVSDKKKRELILDRLTKLTGQAPVETVSKKAISTFKLRVGDTSGYMVTLRGARMRSFLDKLIHVVFPRVRDFRGIAPTSIDEMGNISVGFKDHTVFPETADEESKDLFGLAVTIGTTAKNKKEAEAFLRHIGIPLREAK